MKELGLPKKITIRAEALESKIEHDKDRKNCLCSEGDCYKCKSELFENIIFELLQGGHLK